MKNKTNGWVSIQTAQTNRNGPYRVRVHFTNDRYCGPGTAPFSVGRKEGQRGHEPWPGQPR